VSAWIATIAAGLSTPSSARAAAAWIGREKVVLIFLAFGGGNVTSSSILPSAATASRT
jgi:hypothetical protein